MELQTVNATTRQPRGKSGARRMRRDGMVPAVVYGGEREPASLALNKREFERVLHGRGGEHAVVQISVSDNADLSCSALIKEVQHHPVRGDVIHADFMRIRLDERITTLVPLVLKGQAKGVVEGGVLDHQLRELEVECLALEVPEEIAVDVSELQMGDSIHVGDIHPPANVTVVTELDRTIVAVHAPRVVKETVEVVEPVAPEEGEAAAEEGAEAEKGEEE